MIHNHFFLHSGLNQIGHFNTENVTKLTKTKQTTTPLEETEVCSKKKKSLLLNLLLIHLIERKKNGG
jgi:hypothetical protein